MRRILLLTPFLLIGTTAAPPDDGLLKWEGSLQFLTQSSSCQGQINLVDNQRVRYYPRMGAGPKTSFVMFRPHETELIRFTDAGGGQFGSGGADHYDLIRIGGGQTLEQALARKVSGGEGGGPPPPVRAPAPGPGGETPLSIARSRKPFWRVTFVEASANAAI